MLTDISYYLPSWVKYQLILSVSDEDWEPKEDFVFYFLYVV